MIKIENQLTCGVKDAIRGMRNPMNSWDKSDSVSMSYDYDGGSFGVFSLGSNDEELMRKLIASGPVHAKFRRMIVVYADVIAPLYWWKEYDTYKVGTVANSCSTMHKIQEKEFTLDDFSCEHLYDDEKELFKDIINTLNADRELYLNSKRKEDWWQLIQLLPSSYNQKRTIMLNYEVLANIYENRKDHKLDEWQDFCKWIEKLEYSWIITGKEK